MQLVLSQQPSSETTTNVAVLAEIEDVPMVTTVEEYSFPASPQSDHILAAFDWLLVHLPDLPYFDVVRVTCCTALRQVSLESPDVCSIANDYLFCQCIFLIRNSISDLFEVNDFFVDAFFLAHSFASYDAKNEYRVGIEMWAGSC